ncbi:MAG TPA: phosphate ABC transporter permease subunit PstC, partial [Desulfohalobiaceae bacterium]|nr:phosphate ABC transporter permease subunit PstC [Desulfohalobiaceae bacterium]
MLIKRQNKERLIHWGFFLVGATAILLLGLILIFLIVEGVPIFQEVSVQDFIFGKYWYPTDDPADFGIFPLIMGSVAVTALSSAIAVPLGILSAIYLA